MAASFRVLLSLSLLVPRLAARLDATRFFSFPFSHRHSSLSSPPLLQTQKNGKKQLSPFDYLLRN